MKEIRKSRVNLGPGDPLKLEVLQGNFRAKQPNRANLCPPTVRYCAKRGEHENEAAVFKGFLDDVALDLGGKPPERFRYMPLPRPN